MKWGGHRTTGLVLAFIGSAAQVAGITGGAVFGSGWATPAVLAGTVLLGVGLFCYARSKGRSPLLCMGALASFYGLLLVALLRDRTEPQEWRPPDPAADDPGARRARRAATASWVIPLAAMLVWSTARSAAELPRDYAAAALLAQVVVVGAGLGLGISALAAVRRHGRPGIVKPAVVGVTINGLVILACMGVLGARAAAREWRRGSLAPAVDGRDLRWAGSGTWCGAMFALASWADGCGAARFFCGSLADRGTVVTVAMDNSGGAGSLQVDLGSARALLVDGSTREVVAGGETFGPGEQRAARWLAGRPQVLQVSVGGHATGLLLVPHGFDMSQVVGFVVPVNGEEVLMGGLPVPDMRSIRPPDAGAPTDRAGGPGDLWGPAARAAPEEGEGVVRAAGGGSAASEAEVR